MREMFIKFILMHIGSEWNVRNAPEGEKYLATNTSNSRK